MPYRWPFRTNSPCNVCCTIAPFFILFFFLLFSLVRSFVCSLLLLYFFTSLMHGQRIYTVYNTCIRSIVYDIVQPSYKFNIATTQGESNVSRSSSFSFSSLMFNCIMYFIFRSRFLPLSLPLSLSLSLCAHFFFLLFSSFCKRKQKICFSHCVVQCLVV